jgi:hypothetical protein
MGYNGNMDIKFTDEQSSAQSGSSISQPSGMNGRLIKMGLAKDSNQANYILFGVIGILAVIFLITASTFDNTVEPVPENNPALIDPVL